MLAGRVMAALGVVGLVAAAPQVPAGPNVPGPPVVCPQTMCIDGLNPDCGIRWGGQRGASEDSMTNQVFLLRCYDVCKPSLKPTMPPCSKTTRSITRSTVKPSPRPTAPPSLSRSVIKPTGIGNCSSRTVCVDYVNDCGQWYGGCHSDCRPWPSYTPPPCGTNGLPVIPAGN
ncbi:hypothetical protein CSOJ01_07725 [Colletotrichum sojae]|uniref:Uncharacterized protein n=1 Tax=Colletotrichum sojae TaxID=2175907 RepID=A0A8H6J7T8_9PEZI|nr:hypothetical protein CSOJ01_07725 [Colletotrichum sojae]